MLNSPAGVSYWPSFEMVRWLGVYFEDVFGLEDQRSRHVSSFVIQNIIGLFLAIIQKMNLIKDHEKDNYPIVLIKLEYNLV